MAAASIENLAREKVILATITRLGYSTAKPEQLQAILGFLEKKDVFVSLPTGFGKSLCFGILPLLYDHLGKRKGSLVVIISPLIALMDNQIESFVSKGLTAVRVGHHDSNDSLLISGHYQLVFVSPETIMKRKWRKMLLTDVYQKNCVGLIVDEAHCVRQWYADVMIVAIKLTYIYFV